MTKVEIPQSSKNKWYYIITISGTKLELEGNNHNKIVIAKMLNPQNFTYYKVYRGHIQNALQKGTSIVPEWIPDIIIPAGCTLEQIEGLE